MTVKFIVIIFQLSEIYLQTVSISNPISNNLKIYVFKNLLNKNRKQLKKIKLI